MSDENRAFETTVEVEAPGDAVWQALTDARELTRWFPLDARVEPGPGGRIVWSWGADWPGEWRIAIWEPGRRLRMTTMQVPYDVNGQPRADAGGPREVALDVQIESRLGKTRVRLVHSGFGRGAAWDDELDGITQGWLFEMQMLRHYLERHRGKDRHMAMARGVTSLPMAAAWQKLTNHGALDVVGGADQLRDSGKYEVRSAWGDVFGGRVIRVYPPWELGGTVEALDDGVFRLGLYRVDSRSGVHLTLATWGRSPEETTRFGTHAQALIDRVLAP
jgi:uncharacterized protein YndB with AHSA1/START domain